MGIAQAKPCPMGMKFCHPLHSCSEAPQTPHMPRGPVNLFSLSISPAGRVGHPPRGSLVPGGPLVLPVLRDLPVVEITVEIGGSTLRVQRELWRANPPRAPSTKARLLPWPQGRPRKLCGNGWLSRQLVTLRAATPIWKSGNAGFALGLRDLRFAVKEPPHALLHT